MYCQNCGNQVNDVLNYCNHCGERNEKNALIVSNSTARIFPIAAGVVGASGLIGTIPILQILLQSGVNVPAVVIILLAYLTAVFLMFAVLVGHIWKRSGDIRVHSHQVDETESYIAPQSLQSLSTSRLEAAPKPGSITEHTTRTLDEVLVERK